MIDYKATGELHSAVRTPNRIDSEVVFLVLVYDGGAWCFAEYINGCSERLNGRYFGEMSFATAWKEYLKKANSYDWS